MTKIHNIIQNYSVLSQNSALQNGALQNSALQQNQFPDEYLLSLDNISLLNLIRHNPDILKTAGYSTVLHIYKLFKIQKAGSIN